MVHEQVEALINLLVRAEAAWHDQALLNLTESAPSPKQAYDRVLDETGRRKKALAARWLAIALRDYDRDSVGAAVRFLRAWQPRADGLQRLRALLLTPD